MSSTSSPKVPVGVTTIAGYSTSVVTLAGAVAAYLTGDRSRDVLVILLLGVYSAVSFAVTQVGRYVQAKELAKPVAVVSSGAVNVDPEFTPDPDPPNGPDPSVASAKLDSPVA